MPRRFKVRFLFFLSSHQTKLIFFLVDTGDDPRVLNGTADAYLATFLPGGTSNATVKAEAADDDDDDEEDEKPAAKKRKAPVVKKEKVVKQAKLVFAK